MLRAVAFILSQSCKFKSISYLPSILSSFLPLFIHSLIHSLFLSFLTYFPFLIYDINFISINAFETMTFIKFSCHIYPWAGFLETRDPGRAHRSPCQRDAADKRVLIKCAPPQCCPSGSAGSGIKRTKARPAVRYFSA